MTFAEASSQFLELVKKVNLGLTARSENDLSSHLALVLRVLDLFPVLDTSGATVRGGKRPDVLGYVSHDDADLVLPAEIVIESKRPEEVSEFASLADAIVSEKYWSTKTYPYLRDNISRVQYFALTTFTSFAVFAVTGEIRNRLIELVRGRGDGEQKLRAQIRAQVIEFDLTNALPNSPEAGHAWIKWVSSHWNTSTLRPVSLSSTRNALPVRNESDLEHLASRLATFAAGAEDWGSRSGLFQSIRQRLGDSYVSLNADVRADLLIFVISQHVDMNTSEAEVKVKHDVVAALDEFVAASIHSLISRLFAVKVIEDAYCVGSKNTLIETALALFDVNDYDGLDAEQIRTTAFQRLRRLKDSDNPVVTRLVQYGFFFDWIEGYIDPVLFRSLFETLSAHDFSFVEGDLLGRFYELYAQQTNRTKRRELGQYYTPLPIVEFMWDRAVRLVEERAELERLTVLDPAMGSATFLTEGARVLAAKGLPRFWERLIGFDISAQILGIAYVNLYMAVLSRLTQADALKVDDLRLFATDTLDYENENYLRQLLPLITDDAHRIFLQQRVAISTKAKKEGSYRLIIGNPPYKNNSDLTLGQVAQRFPHLLTSSVEHGGAQQRNIRDDYAWFLAAADYYVEDEGVICFILSDSFASNRSYEHLRMEILRNFHVRSLVRLGQHVFPDVSYRTSFAILMLERRTKPLVSPEAECVPYSDLRDLISEIKLTDLGGVSDPRFLYLRQLVSSGSAIATSEHSTTSASRYSFYPPGEVPEKFSGMPSLHDDHGDVVFIDTYPGIITAFDVLFRGDTVEELTDRVTSLFSVCSGPGSELKRRLESWAIDRSYSERQLDVLLALGAQIHQKSIAFDPQRIKRTFSGSIPTSARWYPPAEFVHYLYYEPSLLVPRKNNPGKQVGWGSMNQWRDPSSHAISPKLIYTTAKSPNHGYSAFVAEDEWYVKLHGGLSQQFHYTGLDIPNRPPRLDGLPNNLSLTGEALFLAFQHIGATSDTLLYFIAAIWNSELAEQLLTAAGTAIRPGIKKPINDDDKRLALEIAENAKVAREIARLLHVIRSGEAVPASLSSFDVPLLDRAGIQQRKIRSRRFLDDDRFVITGDPTIPLLDELDTVEARIDSGVERLYS